MFGFLKSFLEKLGFVTSDTLFAALKMAEGRIEDDVQEQILDLRLETDADSLEDRVNELEDEVCDVEEEIDNIGKFGEASTLAIEVAFDRLDALESQVRKLRNFTADAVGVKDVLAETEGIPCKIALVSKKSKKAPKRGGKRS